MIRIKLPILIASQQAKREKKEEISKKIETYINDVDYYFTGDVKIDVMLLLDEYERYCTDKSPDIDNILKPLLDSLSGFNKLIIDDNQVQTITCHWVDTNQNDPQSTIIEISSLIPDEKIHKIDLIFIEVHDNIFMPWNKKLLSYGQEIAKSIKEINGSYPFYDRRIRRIYPNCRFFHKSRICSKDFQNLIWIDT